MLETYTRLLSNSPQSSCIDMVAAVENNRCVENTKTDQRCRETRATSAEVPPKVQLGLCLIVAALHFGAFWLRGSDWCGFTVYTS